MRTSGCEAADPSALTVYLLFVAFGMGVWQSAASRRKLRVIGGLLVKLGVMALTVGQFVPIRLRGTNQGSPTHCTLSREWWRIVLAVRLIRGGTAILKASQRG